VEGSRSDDVNVYIILPAALGPGVYSASIRNWYPETEIKMFLGSRAAADS
jgi:hypothetical protein